MLHVVNMYTNDGALEQNSIKILLYPLAEATCMCVDKSHHTIGWFLVDEHRTFYHQCFLSVYLAQICWWRYKQTNNKQTNKK